MLKIPSRFSIVLSITLSVMFFIACIGGAFVMPRLVELLIDLPDNIGNRDNISQLGRVFVHIMSYLILIVFVLADAFLFALLLRVRKGLVFTEKSVSLVRGVSWCCIILSLILLGLGIYFQLSIIAAFLAVFLGLCLRVVKNVIEEATEIKSENDLTV